MKIFFVLPMYNDQLSLSNLIDDLRKIFDKDDYIIEFIIVDDGSTIKSDHIKNIKGAHYIKLKSNQGNQKAIFVGINFLNDLNEDYDYLIVMDSDGEDDPKDVPTLIKESKKILSKAIKAGGTTLNDYFNAESKPGYFKIQLKVYGRDGEKCKCCETNISKITQNNRSTYFCKESQN